METARIGATPKGGIRRPTLTDLDRQARDWFKHEAEALGCTVTVDDISRVLVVWSPAFAGTTDPNW
jgi:N-carbamoyl-L-amino-acid hydrolase